MGQFPYDCIICGGGHERCGSDHEHSCAWCGGCRVYECSSCKETCRNGINCTSECSGGQTCWEDDCVILISKKTVASQSLNPPTLKLIADESKYIDELQSYIIQCQYDSYGGFHPSEIRFLGSPYFYFSAEKTDLYNGVPSVLCDKVFCKSCFEKQPLTLREESKKQSSLISIEIGDLLLKDLKKIIVSYLSLTIHDKLSATLKKSNRTLWDMCKKNALFITEEKFKQSTCNIS